MSEKLARNDIDNLGETRTARNRSVFRLQMQLWPCDCTRSGTIPANRSPKRRFRLKPALALLGYGRQRRDRFRLNNLNAHKIEVGSLYEGVNRVAIPPSEDSAAVEDWLAQNRDSIEGTWEGPFNPTSRYVTTFSSDRIYVHVLDPFSGQDQTVRNRGAYS